MSTPCWGAVGSVVEGVMRTISLTGLSHYPSWRVDHPIDNHLAMAHIVPGSPAEEEVAAMNGRDVAVVIGVVVVVLLLVALLGGGMMMGWGMMGPGMMGWGFGFNPLGWVVMLLFWLLIIGGVALLAVWFFRQATPAAMGPHPPTSALDILKERYARGEITREQYEEMRHEIEGR